MIKEIREILFDIIITTLISIIIYYSLEALGFKMNNDSFSIFVAVMLYQLKFKQIN